MSKVLIIFGSQSDEKTYTPIVAKLKELGVEHTMRVSSAHKSPKDVAKTLEEDWSVVIAGAGLAAHLPGVVASKVIRPVIGVPCGGNYQGLDALLSVAQMPPGVPVMSVGVDKGEAAAVGASLMLKQYETIALIGDEESKGMQKALKVLRELEIPHKFSEEVHNDCVNIVFTRFDEPIERKDELVIYCPVLNDGEDAAEVALSFLKHTDHGLWVGLNNGTNAAIAAIEILNRDNRFEEKLLEHRRGMEEKLMKANE